MKDRIAFALFTLALVLVIGGPPAARALSPAMSTLESIAAVSCGTTATKVALPTASPARSICIQNQAAVDVYVGGSTVTTDNGFILPAGSTALPTEFCFDAQTGWCVVAAATSPVRVLAGTGYSGK